MSPFFVFFAILAAGPSLASTCEIPNFDAIQQQWGYAAPRDLVHQFWWFMKNPCEDANTKPIVIWLQGGPGGSGTGYGNFMEVGPIDNNLEPRNYTWLKEASLLFIDSPVGAGFSYVDDLDAMTTTVYEVADDLVGTLVQLTSVLKTKMYNGSALPPIFIFSESYGGKVAPVFGSKIVQAQAKGKLSDVILGGVAIGDGAVSMMDSGTTYPDYLWQTSQIDIVQWQNLTAIATAMGMAYSWGDFDTANTMLSVLMGSIANMTDDVFFYNIIYHHQPSPSLKANAEVHMEALERVRAMITDYPNMTRHEQRKMVKGLEAQIKLENPMKKLTIDYNGENVKALMNKQMRKKFGIIPKDVKWGAQALECYMHLADELIIDVIESVDACLDDGVRVIVYNGMLDFIINSVGQDKWISKLGWSELKNYYESPRVPLYAPSQAKDQRTGAFYKGYKNFEYYWMLMSGHMVPIDAPEMSLEMLRRIINDVRY